MVKATKARTSTAPVVMLVENVASSPPPNLSPFTKINPYSNPPQQSMSGDVDSVGNTLRLEALFFDQASTAFMTSGSLSDDLDRLGVADALFVPRTSNQQSVGAIAMKLIAV